VPFRLKWDLKSNISTNIDIRTGRGISPVFIIGFVISYINNSYSHLKIYFRNLRTTVINIGGNIVLIDLMASIYFAASEIVILSVIFFTNGVIIIVIGKPIANVVKNMPNHISKKL
jgi:Zn-dependent membrane protease YugP